MRKSNERDLRTFDYWFTIDLLRDNDPRFGIEAALTHREKQPADLIGRVSIIELSGEPIGFIGIYPDEMRNVPIEAARLYLQPKHRGCGYGKDLLLFVEKLAIEENLTEIFAVISALNNPMRKVFEHNSRWRFARQIRRKIFYRRNLLVAR